MPGKGREKGGHGWGVTRSCRERQLTIHLPPACRLPPPTTIWQLTVTKTWEVFLNCYTHPGFSCDVCHDNVKAKRCRYKWNQLKNMWVGLRERLLPLADCAESPAPPPLVETGFHIHSQSWKTRSTWRYPTTQPPLQRLLFVWFIRPSIHILFNHWL